VTERETRDWALAYASLGWRVYPIVSGTKRPFYEGWLRDATTDRERICRSWRDDAGARNVGVVAGETFDVFDIEAEHVDAFRHLLQTHELPPTPIGRSGGGGLHFYIAPLGLGTRRLLLDGSHVGELKGSGGIVVPPSVTGGTYRWLRSPLNVPICAAPTWLCDLIAVPPAIERGPSGPLSPSRAVALMAGLYRVVSQAGEGERNTLLFWAACRVAENVLEPYAATDILLAAALEAGLPEREARATIGSGLRRA
jgi:Bifunctional DNA primase/polymerase, N-terminal